MTRVPSPVQQSSARRRPHLRIIALGLLAIATAVFATGGPTVTSYTFPNSSVYTDGDIVVTFNTDIDSATVTSSNIYVTYNDIVEPTTVVLSPSNTITLHPDQAWTYGTLKVTVTAGIKDTLGNPFAGGYVTFGFNAPPVPVNRTLHPH